jgi:hypothetical protein
MTTTYSSLTKRYTQSSTTVTGDPNADPKFWSSTGFTEWVFETSVNGEDTPGWRKLIKAGGAPFGNLTSYRTKSVGGSASFHRLTQVIRWIDGHWEHYFDVNTTASGFPNALVPLSYGILSSSVVNSAKAKYVQRAAELRRAIQGGVVLGELRETVHMIMGTAHLLGSGLTGYYNALKKGRRSLRKAGKKTKTEFIREQYLQYTYGWGPLISDIKSGANALVRYQNARPERTPVRANATGDTLVSRTPYSGTIGDHGFSCANYITDRTECWLYGAYDTRTSESSSPASLAGMSWRDFVPTVWELIPYSFLIDYFTNIGNIITALSYAKTGAIYSGMTTKATRTVEVKEIDYSVINIDMSLDPLDPHNGVHETFSTGKNAWVTEQTVRVKNPDLTPSFEVSLKGLSPHRILNIIALLPNFRNLTPF